MLNLLQALQSDNQLGECQKGDPLKTQNMEFQKEGLFDTQ